MKAINDVKEAYSTENIQAVENYLEETRKGLESTKTLTARQSENIDQHLEPTHHPAPT